MNVLITADLHFGKHPVFDKRIRKFVKKVNESNADILILAGDTSVFGNGYAEALSLFNDFKGERLMIAGNHDLWTNNGNSLKLYQEGLPYLAAEFGFHSLDKEPRVVGSIGVAGTVGWYDYSYRIDASVRRKFNFEIEKKAVNGRIVWNDARFIKMDYSDKEFTDILLDKVECDLEFLSRRVDKIIFISHHVPFENMIFKTNSLPWSLVNVYLGSKRFGELLLKYDKVRYMFCGHSHNYVSCQNGHIKCVNIGSTYRNKRYELLEL